MSKARMSDFKILSNEMRRQIVTYLSREKILTFTQIMDFLGLDPLWQCGTVGYHLNILVDSGVLRKHKDGYVLTAEGRSLVNVIDRIEYVESDRKMNNSKIYSPERIFDTLNARAVCWLLAVAKGVKPTATILSVYKENWNDFSRLLRRLDLCSSYEGSDGMVLTCQVDEGEKIFGNVPTRFNEGAVNFVFDEREWAELLSGKKPSFKTVDSSSAQLTPIIYHSPNVAWEVIVSKDVEDLLRFARVNQRTGGKPACLSNHVERGKALGYPECCIEEHTKGDVWGLNARASFFKELIDLGLDKKMPVEFWAVAHIPHSAKCEESLKLGRKYLDAMKSFSPSLYDSTLRRLQVSYLPYSIGERFISFKEIPRNQFPEELEREYFGVFDWTKKIVSEKVELTLGDVQRPEIFYDDEKFPRNFRIIPELMGLKWVAFSPGEGSYIKDTKTDEVYLYLLLKWVLPNEYEKIIDTVCRVYKCN